MFTSLFTDYGVRPTGYQDGPTFKVIPEMIPEIVVPDLTGFKVLHHYLCLVDTFFV